jgi:integrase
MRTLAAATLTEARRERESLLAGLREGRVAAPTVTTLADVLAEYQHSRKLASRTRDCESTLARQHLGALLPRRLQDVTVRDVAGVMSGMRDAGYSEWTRVGVYRILRGTFQLAVGRGIIPRSPVEGLSPSERPKQRNARRVAVLDATAIERLIAAGSTGRWRAALGLAAYAGLRLGELRALTWADVDFEAGIVNVRRAADRDGALHAPKTAAGVRAVPLLPALRRLLVEWKLRSPRTEAAEFVIGTADGNTVGEQNLRRMLERAKEAAGLAVTEERLSWHSLRHSFASLLATELGLPTTTLAQVMGHADAGFTLRVYARDGRDTDAIVTDMLARAHEAGVGA